MTAACALLGSTLGMSLPNVVGFNAFEVSGWYCRAISGYGACGSTLFAGAPLNASQPDSTLMNACTYARGCFSPMDSHAFAKSTTLPVSLIA